MEMLDKERPVTNNNDKDNHVTRKMFPRGYCSELKIQVIMALPLMITNISQYMPGPVALMFCGRLGTLELDTASLANSAIVSLGMATVMGLSTACDTLFSQLYGSTNRQKLGVALIRSIILIPMCAIPAVAIILNAENLLILFGQHEQVARYTAQYLYIFIPGLVALFIYLPLTKYLQCQNMIVSPMIISLIGNIINIVLHFILVVYLQKGTVGSAVALTVTYVAFPLVTLAYILMFKVHTQTWTGWSAESLLDWSQFFWLGVFGLVMIGFDWWSYELGFFLSGILGTTELAAQAILFQIALIFYMPATGLSISSNIRVGHFLGANDPEGAINCYRVSLSVIWLVYIALAVLLVVTREILPLVFTNIPEVTAMATATIPWYALVCVFEGPYEVCSGILRGSGRQNIGSCVIIGSYIVGLAIAIPTMFKTRSITGLWKGLAIAVSSACLILCVLVLRTNWRKQALKAQDRVGASVGKALVDEDNNSFPISAHQRRRSVDDDEEHHPFIDQTAGQDLKPLVNTECESHHIVDGHRPVTTRVYVRTLLVALAMLSILMAGIMCKLWIPTTSNLYDLSNNVNGVPVINDTLV